MHNLAEFLRKNNHWLLFVVLEVISLVLLFRFNSYQGSVWFTSANYVSGKVYEMESKIEAFFSLTRLNQELTQRNLYLEQQVKEMSEALYDRRHAAERLKRGQLRMLSQYHLIPAKVVDNTTDRSENFITIDKGSADGVRKDMGVVCGQGIVGIVYLCNEHYSVIIPVLNEQSNISCAIRGRGFFGYLRWYGGSPESAYVEDIPRHAHFRLGDFVVTSGYSSVFPPGIIVGRIKHVYNSDNGLSYRLNISLSTDFARLRDVSVINDREMDKKLELLRAAEDSLKARQ